MYVTFKWKDKKKYLKNYDNMYKHNMIKKKTMYNNNNNKRENKEIWFLFNTNEIESVFL